MDTAGEPIVRTGDLESRAGDLTGRISSLTQPRCSAASESRAMSAGSPRSIGGLAIASSFAGSLRSAIIPPAVMAAAPNTACGVIVSPKNAAPTRNDQATPR